MHAHHALPGDEDYGVEYTSDTDLVGFLKSITKCPECNNAVVAHRNCFRARFYENYFPQQKNVVYKPHQTVCRRY